VCLFCYGYRNHQRDDKKNCTPKTRTSFVIRISMQNVNISNWFTDEKHNTYRIFRFSTSFKVFVGIVSIAFLWRSLQEKQKKILEKMN